MYDAFTMTANTGQKGRIEDRIAQDRRWMLLLQTAESADAGEKVLANIREQFVMAHHSRAITTVAQGKKKGRYRTYIGEPRRQIEAVSYNAIIIKLYEYYIRESLAMSTLSDGTEWLIQEMKLKNGVKESTVYRVRKTLERFSVSELMGKQLVEITEEDVYTSIRARIASITEVKGVAPAMSDVGAYIRHLRSIFRLAESKGVVAVNPMGSIDKNDFKRSCMAKSRRAEDNVLSLADIHKLETALKKEKNNPLAFAGRISIWSGMRGGEIPALRWNDYDTEKGYLHIHRQQLWDEDEHGKRIRLIDVEWTKNEKGIPRGGRHIPVIPELYSVLEEVKAWQVKNGIYRKDGYVVCNPDGSPVRKDGYEHHLNRLCKKLGLSVTNNHSLRKSYNGNILISRYGLDVRERSKVMGHSEEVNERFYTFTDESVYQSITGKIRSASWVGSGHSLVTQKCS